MGKQDNINKELEMVLQKAKIYSDEVTKAQEVIKKGCRMMEVQKKEGKILKRDILLFRKNFKEDFSPEVLEIIDKILNVVDQLNGMEGKYGEYIKKR